MAHEGSAFFDANRAEVHGEATGGTVKAIENPLGYLHGEADYSSGNDSGENKYNPLADNGGSDESAPEPEKEATITDANGNEVKASDYSNAAGNTYTAQAMQNEGVNASGNPLSDSVKNSASYQMAVLKNEVQSRSAEKENFQKQLDLAQTDEDKARIQGEMDRLDGEIADRNNQMNSLYTAYARERLPNAERELEEIYFQIKELQNANGGLDANGQVAYKSIDDYNKHYDLLSKYLPMTAELSQLQSAIQMDDIFTQAKENAYNNSEMGAAQKKYDDAVKARGEQYTPFERDFATYQGKEVTGENNLFDSLSMGWDLAKGFLSDVFGGKKAEKEAKEEMTVLKGDDLIHGDETLAQYESAFKEQQNNLQTASDNYDRMLNEKIQAMNDASAAMQNATTQEELSEATAQWITAQEEYSKYANDLNYSEEGKAYQEQLQSAMTAYDNYQFYQNKFDASFDPELAQKFRNIEDTALFPGLDKFMARTGMALVAGGQQVVSGVLGADAATMALNGVLENKEVSYAVDALRTAMDREVTDAEFEMLRQTMPNELATMRLDSAAEYNKFINERKEMDRVKAAKEEKAHAAQAKADKTLEQATYGTGKLGEFFYSAIPSITGMSADAIANIIVPGSGLAAMGIRVFGDAYNSVQMEVDENGNRLYDDNTALLYGMFSAAVEVATEKMGGDSPFNMLVYGSNKAGKEAFDKFIGNISSDAAKAWIQFAKGAVEEGGEEVISELAAPFLDAIKRTDDTGYWEEAFKNMSDKDITDYVKAFLGGATVSAIMGGGATAIGVATNKAQNQNQSVSERIAQHSQEVANASGTVTEAQKQQAMRDAEMKVQADQAAEILKNKQSQFQTEETAPQADAAFAENTQTVQNPNAQSQIDAVEAMQDRGETAQPIPETPTNNLTDEAPAEAPRTAEYDDVRDELRQATKKGDTAKAEQLRTEESRIISEMSDAELADRIKNASSVAERDMLQREQQRRLENPLAPEQQTEQQTETVAVEEAEETPATEPTSEPTSDIKERVTELLDGDTERANKLTDKLDSQLKWGGRLFVINWAESENYVQAVNEYLNSLGYRLDFENAASDAENQSVTYRIIPLGEQQTATEKTSATQNPLVEEPTAEPTAEQPVQNPLVGEQTAEPTTPQTETAQPTSTQATPTQQTAATPTNVQQNQQTEQPDIPQYNGEGYNGATDEAYQNLVDENGRIIPGENPSRDFAVPTENAEGQKIGRSVRTIAEAEATPEERLNDIKAAVVNGEFAYTTVSNNMLANQARQEIENDGWEKSLGKFISAAYSGKVNAKMSALGAMLINNAGNSNMSGKDYTDLVMAYYYMSHNTATALQAERILKTLSPEAKLYAMEKTVQQINNSKNEANAKTRKGKKAAKNAPDAAEVTETVGKVKADVAEEMQKDLTEYSEPSTERITAGTRVKALDRGNTGRVVRVNDDGTYVVSFRARDGLQATKTFTADMIVPVGSNSKTKAKNASAEDEVTPDSMAQQIADKLSRAVEPAKEKTADQILADDILRLAKEKLPAKETTRTVRTATDVLTELASNEDFAREVYEKAQGITRENSNAEDADIDTTNRLERFTNESVYLSESKTVQRAIAESAVATDETKAMIQKQTALGISEGQIANRIADDLIAKTGVDGELADSVREAAQKYVSNVINGTDVVTEAQVSSMVNKAMSDIGETFRNLATQDDYSRQNAQNAIADMLTEKYGVDGQSATEIAAAVADQFSAKLDEAIGKELERRYGDKKTAKGKTVKTLAQELTENINLGAFNSQYAQKAVNKVFGVDASDVQIPQDLIDSYLAQTDDIGRNAVMDEITANIAAQIPATAMEKFTAIRYLNMLGNLKTQVRNMAGNTAMILTRGAKDAVRAALETTAQIVSGGKYQKTASFFYSEESRQAAANDFNTNKDIQKQAMGERKYSSASQEFSAAIEEARQKNIFRSRVLQGYKNAVDWLMNDFGDWIFVRENYVNALAGYLQAHKISSQQWSEMVNDPLRTEEVEAARSYAIKEAQEATFRDSNVASQMAQNMLRGDSIPNAVKIVGEGIEPFRKTPANVLVRMEEYSPLGAINTAVKAIKGDSLNEILNSLAKTVTGSGLTLLGALMASKGHARTKDDDDKEEAYAKLMGMQDFSVMFNGKSYTMDWLTPDSAAFFMGVEAYNAFKNGEVTADNLLNILGNLTSPMLEMSMLSSLNDSLDNLAQFNGDTSAFGQFLLNSMLSFATQAVNNSLIGQMEQFSEKFRQTYYTEDNPLVMKGVQKSLAKMSGKIPMWDYQTADYIDAWGRKQAAEENPLLRGVETFLSPGYSSDMADKTTAVDEELLRLYEYGKTQDKFPNVLPQTASRSTLVNGTKLTADEYEKYATVKGEESLNLISEFMESDYYGNLSDDAKADIIQDLYSFAAYKAASAVAESRGETYEGASNITNLLNGVDKNNDNNDTPALNPENLVRYSAFDAAYKEAAGNKDGTAMDKVLDTWNDLDNNTRSVLVKREPNINDLLLWHTYDGVSSSDYYAIKGQKADSLKHFNKDAESSVVTAYSLDKSGISESAKKVILENNLLDMSNTVMSVYDILSKPEYGSFTLSEAADWLYSADYTTQEKYLSDNLIKLGKKSADPDVKRAANDMANMDDADITDEMKASLYDALKSEGFNMDDVYSNYNGTLSNLEAAQGLRNSDKFPSDAARSAAYKELSEALSNYYNDWKNYSYSSETSYIDKSGKDVGRGKTSTFSPTNPLVDTPTPTKTASSGGKRLKENPLTDIQRIQSRTTRNYLDEALFG